jgi:hypothetical protein
MGLGPDLVHLRPRLCQQRCRICNRGNPVSLQNLRWDSVRTWFIATAAVPAALQDLRSWRSGFVAKSEMGLGPDLVRPPRRDRGCFLINLQSAIDNPSINPSVFNHQSSMLIQSIHPPPTTTSSS